jgi:carbon monoxide dehydrogenase subunit G
VISFSESFAAAERPAVVFAVLADPARVVSCLPGASLDTDPGAEIKAGDELGGGIELKIGPIRSRFGAQVRVLEFDAGAHTYTLGVHAADRRGNGEVDSTVSLTVVEAAAGSDVQVRADIDVRGKIATFGMTTVERVSRRVLQQFAENLAAVIASPASAEAPAVPAPARGTSPAASARASGSPAAVGAPARRDDRWPALAVLLAFACGALGATVFHQRRRR